MLPVMMGSRRDNGERMPMKQFIRIAARLAGLLIPAQTTACFSSLQEVSSTRYQALPPLVKREGGDLNRRVEVLPAVSPGALRVRVTSERRCTVVTMPRYQVIRTEGHVARNLGPAYAFGLTALPGGAAMAIGAAASGKDFVEPTGDGKKEVTSAGVVFISGALLATAGLVALPLAVYHTAKDGKEEHPGEIHFGTPPPEGRPGGAATSSALTSSEICDRHAESGLAVALVTSEEGGQREVIDLGTTDHSGAVSVDILAKLKEAYTGWPEVTRAVQHEAFLALAEDPDTPIARIDLRRHSSLRYGEHRKYIEEYRGRVRAAELLRQKKENERIAEQKRKEAEQRAERARSDAVRAQCTAQHVRECARECQGNDSCEKLCRARPRTCNK